MHVVPAAAGCSAGPVHICAHAISEVNAIMIGVESDLSIRGEDDQVWLQILSSTGVKPSNYPLMVD